MKLTNVLKGILISSTLLIPSISLTSSAAASDLSIGGLLAYSNSDRAAVGENALNLNGALDYAAQAKANDMVANNYWSHYSPSGASPWSFISASGYSYSAAGENLAYGYFTSADVISGWMNSAEHRANLLNAGFVDVGFGIATSPNFVGSGPETIVVAEYGTPLYTPPPAPSYTAPAAPTYTPPAPTAPVASAPVASSAPVDSAPAANDSAPTDSSPAPAPAPTTPATPAADTAKDKVVSKTNNKSAAKHVKAATWVEQLRSGDLAKTSRINLTGNKVSDSMMTSGVVLAICLVLIGHTVLPSRLRR